LFKSYQCISPTVQYTSILSCDDWQGDHSPGKPGKVREFQSGQGKWKKSGKVKSGVFFQALNNPKKNSAGDPTGGAYNAPPDSLVGW